MYQLTHLQDATTTYATMVGTLRFSYPTFAAKFCGTRGVIVTSCGHQNFGEVQRLIVGILVRIINAYWTRIASYANDQGRKGEESESISDQQMYNEGYGLVQCAKMVVDEYNEQRRMGSHHEDNQHWVELK